MVEIISDIHIVGIVGAGVMGTSITNVLAYNGYRVILNDTHQEILDDASLQIENYLTGSVSRNKMSHEDKIEILKRIQLTPHKEDFVDADLVIEVIDENIAFKQEVLKALESIVSKDTIIATNTNSLSVTEIASVLKNPSRVVGMHFLNPSESMELIEITYGERTSKETVSTIKEIAENLNREFVVIQKDTPGHIVNRILIPLLIEAIHIYEDGIASKEDIDKAVRYGLNHPMGPFELQDYIGLDICYQLMEGFADQFEDDRFYPPKTIKELVDAGHVGRKVGKGYYNYTI